jgi:exodeoxyribonuclease-1
MKNMFTSPKRYVHYDTETTGIDPKVDQVVQICLAETDSELEIIKDKQGKESIHMFYMKMRLDVVPNPEAFLVHRTMPSLLTNGTEADNVYTEIEGFKKINDILKKTNNTCITGYNSISFDDEMLRYGNFRNMQNPYEHEWSNKNHRTDIYYLMMVARLFCESAIKWPMGDDDKVSLKLEKLSPENGIIHENAHDAESDILATIGMAKIVKEARPDLYDKFKNLSDKNYISSMINSGQPLIYTSNYILKEQYSTSFILPILQDKENKSKWHAIDLTANLDFFLNSKVEDIQYQMFTSKYVLPVRKEVGLRSFAINKIPLLSLPPSVDGDMGRGVSMKVAKKIGVDYSVVDNNLAIIKERFFEIKEKIEKINSNERDYAQSPDYFQDLYGAFLSNEENYSRSYLLNLKQTEYGEGLNLKYVDVFEYVSKLKSNLNKNAEMTLITKWNNYGKELLKEGNYDPNELILFRNHLKNAYFVEQEGRLNIEDFRIRIRDIPYERELDKQQVEILKELGEYANHLEDFFIIIDSKCNSMKKEAKWLRDENSEIYSKFKYFNEENDNSYSSSLNEQANTVL